MDGQRAVDVPHAQRSAARRVRRRPDRARLPGRPRGPRTPARTAEGAVARRGGHERVDLVLLVRRALLGRGRRDLRARPGRHRGDRRQGAAADGGRRTRDRAPTTSCGSSVPTSGSTRIRGQDRPSASAGPYWASELGRELARRPAALGARRRALRAPRRGTGPHRAATRPRSSPAVCAATCARESGHGRLHGGPASPRRGP